MTKEEIGGILERIATLLELKNENPFKIRAYTNAERATPVSSKNRFSAMRRYVESIIDRYEFYERRGFEPRVATHEMQT